MLLNPVYIFVGCYTLNFHDKISWLSFQYMEYFMNESMMNAFFVDFSQLNFELCTCINIKFSGCNTEPRK